MQADAATDRNGRRLEGQADTAPLEGDDVVLDAQGRIAVTKFEDSQSATDSETGDPDDQTWFFGQPEDPSLSANDGTPISRMTNPYGPIFSNASEDIVAAFDQRAALSSEMQGIVYTADSVKRDGQSGRSGMNNWFSKTVAFPEMSG